MNPQRQHHRDRLKKSRRFYWGQDLRKEAHGAQVVDTPTPCSCWACGNPRRYFGEKSRHERGADGLFRRLGLDA